MTPPIRVFQQAAPPPSPTATNETFKFWPMHVAASAAEMLAKSTEVGVDRMPFVWANRRNFDCWNTKPNDSPGDTVLLDGLECRAVYTTIALANAATRIQVRHILGLDWEPVLANNPGLTEVIPYDEWQDNPSAYFTDEFVWTAPGGNQTQTFKTCTNKVLLHPHAGRKPELGIPDLNTRSDFTGIVLDYECQDDRSDQQTVAIVDLLAKDVRDLAGKKLFLYTNPLNAPSQPHTRINEATLPSILPVVDMISVFMWSGTPLTVRESYAEQIAMLGTMSAAKWAKVVVLFELGGVTTEGTSLADADWLRSVFTAAGTEHPTKVMFWRNYADQGGLCSTLTNRKIRRVCFGT